MKRLPAIIAAIAASSAFAAGETPRPRAVDGVECRRVINDMPGYIQSEFDHYSPGGESAFLRHPLTTKFGIVVACAYGDPTVSFGANTWRPGQDWYTVAALAGRVVSGAHIQLVATNISRCVGRALKTNEGFYTVRGDGIGVECSVVKDVYGGHVFVTLYKHAGRREEY